MAVNMDDIKNLREETGAGIMDVKKALTESKGDIIKAKEWITKKGLARAEKKAAEREANNGVIFSYVHHNHLSGAMVELRCETDFVALTPDFKNLAKEVAMQVTSSDPANIAKLLSQVYIRDSKKTIDQLIKEISGKLGEKIELTRFVRYGLGEAER